jgi:hypothetical protein
MFRTAAAVMLSLAVASPVLAADAPVAERAAAVMTTTAVATAAIEPAPFSRPDARIGQQRPTILPSLYVSLSALQAYDVYSTLTAIRRGASESNPLMKGVVGNAGALVALKAGVTGVSIYAAERLWRDNKKAHAVLLMVASNGLMAYVAANNAAVLRRVR